MPLGFSYTPPLTAKSDIFSSSVIPYLANKGDTSSQFNYPDIMRKCLRMQNISGHQEWRSTAAAGSSTRGETEEEKEWEAEMRNVSWKH